MYRVLQHVYRSHTRLAAESVQSIGGDRALFEKTPGLLEEIRYVTLESLQSGVGTQPLPCGERLPVMIGSFQSDGGDIHVHTLIKYPIRSCSWKAWKDFLKEVGLHGVGGRKGGWCSIWWGEEAWAEQGGTR